MFEADENVYGDGEDVLVHTGNLPTAAATAASVTTTTTLTTTPTTTPTPTPTIRRCRFRRISSR